MDGLSAKLKDEPPQKRKNMAGNGEDEDICLDEDPTYGKKLEEASNTPMISDAAKLLSNPSTNKRIPSESPNSPITFNQVTNYNVFNSK